MTPAQRRNEVRVGITAIVVAVLVVTALTVAIAGTHQGVTSSALRVALETFGVCALLAAALMLALFQQPDSLAPRDALVAALVVIALANAIFGVAPFITGFRPSVDHGLALLPWVAARWLAGLLFVLAALGRPRVGLPLTMAWSLLTFVAVELVLLAFGTHVAPPVQYIDEATLVIVDPFMHVSLQFVPAVLFSVGAWRASVLYRDEGAIILKWLSFALVLQVAAQLHEIMYPAMLGPTVTTADLFRSVAFGALLAGGVLQVRRVDAEKSRTVRIQAHDLRDQQRLVDDLRTFAEQEALFRSIVTHELATPLATIRTYTDVIDKTIGDQRTDDVAAALVHMREEATRLLELSRRLDELSDVDGAGPACVLRPTRIVPIIDETTRFVNALDGAHAVRVDCPDLRVHVDPVRIGQLLRNIAVNAAKFSPVGSVVTITGEVVDTTLRVSVQDEGPGIPDHEIPLVLRRFGRGANAVGTHGQGLGLYIAAQIAAQHNSELTIERTPQGGTKVTCALVLA